MRRGAATRRRTRARVTAEGLFPEGNRWHVVTGANYAVDKRRSVSAGGPVHVGRVLPVGRPPPDRRRRHHRMLRFGAPPRRSPAMFAARRRASALSLAGVSISPASPAFAPRRRTNPRATSAPFEGGNLAPAGPRSCPNYPLPWQHRRPSRASRQYRSERVGKMIDALNSAQSTYNTLVQTTIIEARRG